MYFSAEVSDTFSALDISEESFADFSQISAALTVNGQEKIVNHENTHSTEGTSYLGGKNSKFDT